MREYAQDVASRLAYSPVMLTASSYRNCYLQGTIVAVANVYLSSVCRFIYKCEPQFLRMVVKKLVANRKKIGRLVAVAMPVANA